MGTEPEMDSTPADKPPMKTVLYCRVSTADQTLEHQRIQAEAAGYRFDEVVVDHGIWAFGRLCVTAQRDEGSSTCSGKGTPSSCDGWTA